MNKDTNNNYSTIKQSKEREIAQFDEQARDWHQQSVGYTPSFEPIPSESCLRLLSTTYGLINVILEDENFCYYCAEKA